MGPCALAVAHKSVLRDSAGSAICILFPAYVVTCLSFLVGSVWAIMVWPWVGLTLTATAILFLLAFFKLHQIAVQRVDASVEDAVRMFVTYHLLSIFATVLVLGLTIVPLHFFFGR